MRFLACVVVVSLPAVLAADRKPAKPDLKWDFPKDGDLAGSGKVYKGPYKVRLINEGQIGLISDARGNQVYRVRNGFRIRGDVVYELEYGSHSSGCSLIAFDLKKKKRLWLTHLKGLGPIAHTKYFNQVAIKVVGNVAVIYGNESAGKYVEHVSLKTGKTVAHKKH